MGFMVVAVVVSVAVGIVSFALAYDRRKAAEARVLAYRRPIRVLEVVSLMHAPTPARLPARKTLLGIADDSHEDARTNVFVVPTPAPVPVPVAEEPTRPSRPAMCAERRVATGTRPPGYPRAATPTDVLSMQIATYIADAMAVIESERVLSETPRDRPTRARPRST